MIVHFGDKNIPCIAIEVSPTDLIPRDIIQFGDTLMRVETIQKDCPSWDGPDHFTMYVLRDEHDTSVSMRKMPRRARVFRPIFGRRQQ